MMMVSATRGHYMFTKYIDLVGTIFDSETYMLECNGNATGC